MKKVVVLVFAFLLVSIASSAQMDTFNPVYRGFKKIIRSVNIGYFGCDYQSISYIGNDGRVARIEIDIPNHSRLNIDFEYNDIGDVVREQYSTNGEVLIFENLYAYDTLPANDDLVSYKLREQRTVINGLDKITISAHGAGGIYQPLEEELKNLYLTKYASIFQLIKPTGLSPKYSVPVCNCSRDKDIEHIDALFASRLNNLRHKDSVRIFSDQVFFIGMAIGKKDRYGNWQIRKIKANYKDEIFTVEKIKYKK